MIYYRYLTAQYGLAALQTKEWKIGRLLELNDPLDCQPTLDGGPSQSDETARSDFERRYFSSVYEDIGIICYSAAITDPVVWSHYADSHRGFALGFDYPFDEAPIRVDYPKDDKRAVLDYQTLESLKGPNTQEGLIKVVGHGFTKKAASWSYEQEHRHFIRFDGCSLKGPHYFRSMPVEHLRKIVLGVRCSIAIVDIRRIVASWPNPQSINIVKARTSRDTYTLIV